MREKDLLLEPDRRFQIDPLPAYVPVLTGGFLLPVEYSDCMYDRIMREYPAGETLILGLVCPCKKCSLQVTMGEGYWNSNSVTF